MGQRCLICYDIADVKRLNRLHRWISKQAVMVQYSVYLAEVTRRELEALINGMRQRIDPEEDDVRIYPVPSNCEVRFLGRRDLEDGFTQPGFLLFTDPMEQE